MISAYLRLLIFLLAILIPACDSSSPAFLRMYSAYKLNKQGDDKLNKQDDKQGDSLFIPFTDYSLDMAKGLG